VLLQHKVRFLSKELDNLKERCWAKSLGDCVGPMSGEHYFTAGLFAGDKVFIHGLDWCKDQPKQVGKKSLVKNVLCKSHNERLSILDDEAIRAFEIMRGERDLNAVREKMTPRYWTVKRWSVNGPLFERWFLKTLIGIACEGEQKIGPDSPEQGQPSPSLVRIVYGLEKFPGMSGLYTLAAAGMKVHMRDRIEYVPMGHPDCLPGALFCFMGYFFVIHLGIGGLDPNAELMLPGPTPFGGMLGGGVNVKSVRHMRAAKFAIHGHTSHVIEFKWPGERNNQTP
jgi:hypothetical protein